MAKRLKISAAIALVSLAIGLMWAGSARAETINIAYPPTSATWTRPSTYWLNNNTSFVITISGIPDGKTISNVLYAFPPNMSYDQHSWTGFSSPSGGVSSKTVAPATNSFKIYYQHLGSQTAAAAAAYWTGGSWRITYTDSSTAVPSYSAPAGLSITSVSPSPLGIGQTGVTVTGTGFGASQGGSVFQWRVRSTGNLYTSNVTNTALTWADTSVTFNLDPDLPPNDYSLEFVVGGVTASIDISVTNQETSLLSDIRDGITGLPGMIKDAIAYLFIPDATLWQQDINDLATAANTHFPFAILSDLTYMLDSVMNEIPDEDWSNGNPSFALGSEVSSAGVTGVLKAALPAGVTFSPPDWWVAWHSWILAAWWVFWIWAVYHRFAPRFNVTP